MPAAITHAIFAEKVLDHVVNTNKIEINEEAFIFGSQGPDVFFTHRFFPWMKGDSLKEYGEALHKCLPNKLISYMREYVARKNSPIVASYFLGFICHYSLDSSCHPYINHVAKEQLIDDKRQTESILHIETESAIDTIVYRSQTGELANKVNIGKYFKVSNEIKEEIAVFYSFLIEKLYGNVLGLNIMRQVIDDSAKVFSFVKDSWGIKKTILSGIEGAGKRKFTCHFRPDMESDIFDYMNLNKSPWLDRYGRERTEDFFEIMDQAYARAVETINNIGISKPNQITDNEPFG